MQVLSLLSKLLIKIKRSEVFEVHNDTIKIKILKTIHRKELSRKVTDEIKNL